MNTRADEGEDVGGKMRHALDILQDFGDDLSLSLSSSLSSEHSEGSRHERDDAQDDDDDDDERGIPRAQVEPMQLQAEGEVYSGVQASQGQGEDSANLKRKRVLAQTSANGHGQLRRGLPQFLNLDGSESELEISDSEEDVQEHQPVAVLSAPPAIPKAQSHGSNISEREHFPMGPQLRSLRDGQGANKEYYTYDHLHRLREFEAQVPWNRLSKPSKSYCSKVHKQPCKACTTCHFCRQKTTDVKTWCPCANKKGRIVGGKSRGILCGFCLEMRFGENLEEALSNPDWRCPACRDICNCSGANCSRSRRNLFPTNQLYHEATHMGYKSVAHYLILTHLTDGKAMPMPEVGRGQRPKSGAVSTVELDSEGVNKDSYRRRTKIMLRREIADLRKEFPPPEGFETMDILTSRSIEEEEDQAVTWDISASDFVNQEESLLKRRSSSTPPIGFAHESNINTDSHTQQNDPPVAAIPKGRERVLAARSQNRSQAGRVSSTHNWGSKAPHTEQFHTQGRSVEAATGKCLEKEALADEGEHDATTTNATISHASTTFLGEKRRRLESTGGQDSLLSQEDYGVISDQRPAQDSICYLSMKMLTSDKMESFESNIWCALLTSVKEIPWDELTNSQRNQKASPILAQLPKRSCIIRSESSHEQHGSETVLSINTHEDLRMCCSTMLILGSVLPERQVLPLICKRIFGKSSIVDIDRSDIRAKAIVFDTAFKLLKIMLARKQDIYQAVNLLLDVCTSLLNTHDDLCKVLSAKIELGTMPGINVGSLVLQPVRDKMGHFERISIVRSAMESHEELMLTSLSHFLSFGKYCLRSLPLILEKLICRILDIEKRFSNGTRCGALGYTYHVLEMMNTHTDSGADEISETLRVLGTGVAPAVDNLVSIHYPVRSSKEYSKLTELQNSISDDTVTMAVHLLGKLIGNQLLKRCWKWNNATSYIFKPYGQSQFWHVANTHYRNFAYKLICALFHEMSSSSVTSEAAASVLQAWSVCLLDPMQNKYQGHMTDIVLRLGGLIDGTSTFSEGPSSTSQLRQDKNGQLRAQWIHHITNSAANRSWFIMPFQDMGYLADFVQSARREMVNTGKKLKQWTKSMCAVLSAFQDCSLKVKKRYGMNDRLVALLADELISAMHDCMKSSLNLHYGSSEDEVSQLALARGNLKNCLLMNLNEVVRHISHLVVDDNAKYNASPCLHKIMTSTFESVHGIYFISKPFTIAFYEMVSTSFTCETHPDDIHRVKALCHYVLGTYVRRWLQRTSFATSHHVFVATNAIQFLAILFTQDSMRSIIAMRTFLPPVVGPLVECLFSGFHSKHLSNSQIVVISASLDALIGMEPLYRYIIPEYQSLDLCDTNSFRSRMDLLYTAEPIEDSRFVCCMRIFWNAVFQGLMRAFFEMHEMNSNSLDVLNKQIESMGGLQILTDESSATIRSKLFRLLGRSMPLDSIEKYFSQSRLSSKINNDLSEWKQKIPDTKTFICVAFKFLHGFTASDGGSNWVYASLKALYCIIRAAKTRIKIVDNEYVRLTNVLNAKYDVGSMALPQEVKSVDEAMKDGVHFESDMIPTPMYTQTTQETQKYPACTSQSSTQMCTSATQHKATIVETKDLHKYVDQHINFIGYVISRDPAKGVKPLKSQKHFMSINLGDRCGQVKLILVGSTALSFASALDENTSEVQVLVIRCVKVFKRKDNQQILLQGLSRTSKYLNPNVKAVAALANWVKEKGNFEKEESVVELQRLTGTDRRKVEGALAQANGNHNHAANILLDNH